MDDKEALEQVVQDVLATDAYLLEFRETGILAVPQSSTLKR